jgi:hypothetical protein
MKWRGRQTSSNVDDRFKAGNFDNGDTFNAKDL